MSKANLKKVSDADLSNAGDDFHVLWAIKKSLELLNFDEKGLKAVCLEGIEKNESEELDPTGGKFLGIDLCEYYGGNTFETADSIVISQIKYSTNRQNQNYTFSELYEGKKPKSFKGSIIHRLASIVKPFIDKYGRDQVLHKIIIKLVTNRNVSSIHLNQISEIQQYINTLEGPICFDTVLSDYSSLKGYKKNWKDPFLKLLTASELDSTDFTDFFKILDFDDCGSDSRFFLKSELIQSISRLGINSKNQFNSLFLMIWNKVQPDKRQDRIVTYIDVIREFEFYSIENIFPVSQDFESIIKPIKREQISEIITKIESNSAFVPICIHGGAGYGKTTIVNQIKSSVPNFCECILFDCYGKSKYENPSDRRHLHRKAIMQIANEIAKLIGSDFLLMKDGSDDVYLNELKRRIKQAVEILKDRNPNAYLAIIIDAADNSVSAASKFGEKSFVQDLLEEVIEGCNIIVTTRTHRKDTLNLPKKNIDIKLLPFSKNETKQYLTDKLENATDQEIKEFHKYTYGVPRVQSELLENNNVEISEIIDYLKPEGKTVEELISDKIQIVKNRLGSVNEDLLNQFFQKLITLPRPVPIFYLAEILNVDISFIRDFAFEIWRGLILENDHFSFRDEDFENYIKDNYNIALDELKEIANFFLIKAETDEYASINLASMLYRAECFQELTEITLNRELLIYPKDHIRNKEVYINRVKLALQIARNSKDELTFFKLLFIAAEETKTDRIINDLMIEYPDLITRFGDEQSLLKLKLNSDEKIWAGSFYLKLAGINSRKPENKEITLNYLKIAQDWLKWRQSIKEERENDYKYQISAIDIAYETEANLRIFGIEKAMNALNRWTPLEARLEAAEHLFDNILRFSTPEQITEWLTYPDFKIHDKIFITCSLQRYNKKSEFNLEDIAKELLICFNNPKIKFTLNFQNYIIDFCSILICNKIENSIVLEILSKIKTNNLDRLPSFFKSYFDDNEISFNTHLAKETLIAELNKKEVIPEHFYPDRLKNIDQINDYKKAESMRRDLEELDIFYHHIIPVYTLLSQIHLGTYESENLLEKLKTLITNLKNDYNFDYHLGYKASDKKLNLIKKYTEVALLLANNKEIAINFIIETYQNEKNAIQIRLSVLDKIIYHEDVNTVTLKQLNDVDILIKASNLSGQEMISNYIRCINISNKIDESFSKYLLEEIINASKDIDIEAFEKIRCISSLSEKCLSNQNPKLAYEFSRFVEYSNVKLRGYDHFPIFAGLTGIANFDLSSVLPSICRWHHRNIIKINEEIMPILSHLLKSEYLEHIVVSSLLPIVSYYRHPSEIGHIYELIINKYDLSGNSKLKSTFVRSEFRNLRLDRDHNGIEKLFKSVQVGRFIESTLVSEIQSYLAFLETINPRNDNSSNDISEVKTKRNIDISGIEYTTTNGLKRAVSVISSEDSRRFNTLPKIKELLNEVVEKCSSNQYIQFLNALVDQDEDLISFYTFEEIIEKAINEWDYYPEVKQWKKNNFKFILSLKS